MAYNDMATLIFVGLIWGATNAFMRRGATIISSSSKTSFLAPLLTWQYSLPLIVNLSASAFFFHLLGGSPISLAVPVTNAVTFAATAVTAAVLGEEMHIRRAIFGTSFILLGVWICVA